jgi:muconolactone delta-isomerase
MKELIEIQHELKAPKGQFNSFANFNYRSLEDILEALKPLLWKSKCFITISDHLEQIGDRYYVKADVVLTNSEGVQVSACAYAREALERKGMDSSQVTGSTSSYARKYALNGLFAIDDTKDADNEEHPEVHAPAHVYTEQMVDPLGNRPATPKQVKYLKDLGQTVEEGITFEQAKLRIGSIVNDK